MRKVAQRTIKGEEKQIEVLYPSMYFGIEKQRTTDGSVIPNTTYAVNNIYLNGVRVAAIKPDGQARFYLTDQVDSVKVVVDDNGLAVSRMEYLPYGEEWFSENAADSLEEHLPKFNSQEFDKETGYYYYNARHYDPVVSRFVTADTVIDGEYSTQGWNRYSYVKNNPIKYSDPTGHQALEQSGKSFSNIAKSKPRYLIRKNIENATKKKITESLFKKAAFKVALKGSLFLGFIDMTGDHDLKKSNDSQEKIYEYVNKHIEKINKENDKGNKEYKLFYRGGSDDDRSDFEKTGSIYSKLVRKGFDCPFFWIKKFTWEKLAEEHSRGSNLTPFVSVTTDKKEALRFATNPGGGSKPGYILFIIKTSRARNNNKTKYPNENEYLIDGAVISSEIIGTYDLKTNKWLKKDFNIKK